VGFGSENNFVMTGYQTFRQRRSKPMRPVCITYDPEGDILYITFGQPTASTGYELSDQFLLRVDPGTKKATGLTIFNYSHHSSAAQEIPLRGLEENPKVKPHFCAFLALFQSASFFV
jgi:uncharacterized protein YuzE